MSLRGVWLVGVSAGIKTEQMQEKYHFIFRYHLVDAVVHFSRGQKLLKLSKNTAVCKIIFRTL